MRYYNLYVNGNKDLFTYADKNEEYNLGDMVVVNFKKQKKIAIIIEEVFFAEKPKFRILNINSFAAQGINLNISQIKLIKWLVDYYLCSYKAAVDTVLPNNIKTKINTTYKLNLNNLNLLVNDKKYEKLLMEIKKIITITKAYLKIKFKADRINSLIDKNLLVSEDSSQKNLIPNLKFFEKLKIEDEEIFNYFYNKIKFDKNSPFLKNKYLTDEIFLKEYKEKIEKVKSNVKIENLSSININLTNDQKNIIEEIENNQKDRYFLIKGVTGSGKTEIYMQLIKNAIKENCGSIFLVPEISITPQMIERFKKQFKNNIAILHSSMSLKEIKDEWLALYNGDKKIVLGVRSAIFAPVKNLKYIIIDEEHETTYKQDAKAPYYHAKYVAIKRCLLESAKLILGSATPSIESYFYAKKKIYKLLTLNKRFGTAILPNIDLVDMKDEEDLYFSKKLIEEIRKTLLKNEQVILLLNRKGYSTYLQCKDCGHVEECPNCSIKMTYYKHNNTLKCNYCGATKKFGVCSSCGSNNLIHSGKGIEKIEEELKKYFDVPILLVDGNKNKKNEFFQNAFEDFKNQKYKILIGTQIVAKGLHFPNVTLVGVINADTILNFPDFRASEKTFQLLTQVSGRAGRGEKKGKVIIQTYHIENYSIANSKEENYENFYEKEIFYREKLFYPPFSKIINIGMSSSDEKYLVEKANNIMLSINKMIKDKKIEAYGPMPALVYRVKNRFRYNIFIKGEKKDLNILKYHLKQFLNQINNDNKFTLIIDVDAINLI